MIPETDFDKKKQKFLKDFKAEELLYQSHFKPLAEFIAEELLKNSRAKIIQSNCNKALKVVEELQNTIKTTIEKWIDPMIKKTQKHQQEAHSNLDRSTDKFISDLENSAFYEIDQFKSDLREKMYVHIERKIEDEECKEIFKNELIQGIETLRENIKRRFKECGERFDEQIKEDIERFKEKIKDSLKMLECISIDSGNFDFNTDFNIDNGIDGFALGASIGGLVLLGIVNIWNPVGWVELGIAGLVALVGAVKAMWNVFNPDYKKSQQKEAVNESLNKACEKIAQDVESRIESVKKDIWEKIEKFKADLNGPVENYEYKKERLKEVNKRLGYISNDIKTRSMQ
ncbi:hypothetical protein [Helicobacter pylori]|uniref:hypothetical protein n=1 Tax=Helicobacter pylori TaxID=210 RepID=UPI001F60DB86|nr:hypothetical protein [Helicobacter pylori]